MQNGISRKSRAIVQLSTKLLENAGEFSVQVPRINVSDSKIKSSSSSKFTMSLSDGIKCDEEDDEDGDQKSPLPRYSYVEIIKQQQKLLSEQQNALYLTTKELEEAKLLTFTIQSQKQEIEQKLSCIEQNLLASQKKNQFLKKQITDLAQERYTLKQELATKQKTLESYFVQHSQHEKLVSLLNTTISQEQTEKLLLLKEKEDILRRLNQAELQINQIQEAYDECVKQQKEALLEKQKLESLVADYSRKLQLYDTQISDLESLAQKLQYELDQKTEEHEYAMQRLSAEKDRTKKLEETINEYLEHIDDLKRSYELRLKEAHETFRNVEQQLQQTSSEHFAIQQQLKLWQKNYHDMHQEMLQQSQLLAASEQNLQQAKLGLDTLKMNYDAEKLSTQSKLLQEQSKSHALQIALEHEMNAHCTVQESLQKTATLLERVRTVCDQQTKYIATLESMMQQQDTQAHKAVSNLIYKLEQEKNKARELAKSMHAQQEFLHRYYQQEIKNYETLGQVLLDQISYYDVLAYQSLQRLNEVVQQNQELSQEKDALERTNKKLQQQKQVLQKRSDKRLETVRELNKAYAALKKKNELWKSVAHEEHDTVLQLRSEMYQLQKKCKQLQEMQELATQYMQEIVAEKRDIEQKAIAEKEYFTKCMNELHEEFALARLEYNKLNEHMSSLRQQTLLHEHDLISEMQNAHQQMEFLERRNDELQNIVEQWQERFTDVTLDLSDALQANKLLKKENAELGCLLQKEKHEAYVLQFTLDQAHKTITLLNQEKNHLQQEVDLRGIHLKTAQAAESKIKSEVHQLKQNLQKEIEEQKLLRMQQQNLQEKLEKERQRGEQAQILLKKDIVRVQQEKIYAQDRAVEAHNAVSSALDLLQNFSASWLESMDQFSKKLNNRLDGLDNRVGDASKKVSKIGKRVELRAESLRKQVAEQMDLTEKHKAAYQEHVRINNQLAKKLKQQEENYTREKVGLEQKVIMLDADYRGVAAALNEQKRKNKKITQQFIDQKKLEEECEKLKQKQRSSSQKRKKLREESKAIYQQLQKQFEENILLEDKLELVSYAYAQQNQELENMSKQVAELSTINKNLQKNVHLQSNNEDEMNKSYISLFVSTIFDRMQAQEQERDLKEMQTIVRQQAEKLDHQEQCIAQLQNRAQEQEALLQKQKEDLSDPETIKKKARKFCVNEKLGQFGAMLGKQTSKVLDVYQEQAQQLVSTAILYSMLSQQQKPFHNLTNK